MHSLHWVIVLMFAVLEKHQSDFLLLYSMSTIKRKKNLLLGLWLERVF